MLEENTIAPILARAFDALPEPFTLHDKELNLIFANAAARRMLGLPLEGPIGKHKCHSLYHGTDSPPEFCPARECLEDGTRRELNIYDPHLGITLDLRVMPAPNHSGSPATEFVHHFRPVFTSSPESFREFASMLQDTAFETDGRGVLVYANPKAFALFGYRPDESIGRLNVIEMLAPEERKRAIENFRLSMEGRLETPNEYRALHRNGSMLTVSISSSPVIRDGHPAGLRGVITDLTAAREAERLMQETGSRYRQIFESSPMAIFEEDASALAKRFGELRAEGVGDLGGYFKTHPGEPMKMAALVEIRDLNAEACRLYGIPDKQEAIGPLSRILSEESTPPFIDIIAALYRGERSVEVDALGQNSPGRPGSFSFRLRAEVAPGYEQTLGRVLVSTTDITDRIDLERELAASVEEKQLMLREAHHRIKNNLMIVQSLLRLQAQRLDDPAAREKLMEGEQRIRSIALIHEMLYSTESRRQVDFSRYMEELVKALFKTYAAQERISLELNVQQCCLIDVDKVVACGLIINELVTNSLKYAFPQGAKGTIRVGMGMSQCGTCSMSVEDNGTGLPEGMDIGNSKSLGLMIVHSLVRQLGGGAEVSREGGTSVKIMFRDSPPV